MIKSCTVLIAATATMIAPSSWHFSSFWNLQAMSKIWKKPTGGVQVKAISMMKVIPYRAEKIIVPQTQYTKVMVSEAVIRR
jgi:hypothetical protein